MTFSRFTKYTILVLIFNIVVILLGAYVRASFSGDGCGSNWPLCNGVVIPASPELKTIIEFSHRITSGIALIMVVAMVIWGFRRYAPKHPVRQGVVLTLIFILIEALIGAGIVLLRYVAENKSMWRAVWMSGHLINTYLLIAAIVYVICISRIDEYRSHRRSIPLPPLRDEIFVRRIAIISITLSLILGVSGAISALGATLFPATSLAEGLRQDFSSSSEILTRLRLLHPIIAIISGLFMIYAVRIFRSHYKLMLTLVLSQFAAGFINLFLHAPVWLQIVHLLLADLIWIVLIIAIVNSIYIKKWTSELTEDIKIFTSL